MKKILFILVYHDSPNLNAYEALLLQTNLLLPFAVFTCANKRAGNKSELV